jgi:hypothetical protein
MIAVVALAVATVAFAQKPDFSGSWAPDAPAGGAPGGGGGGGGRGGGGPMTVKQSATELTIERAGREGASVTTVYKLDGSPSKVMGRGGAETTATAKFDGAKLVISTKTDAGEQVQTWSMEGANLVIERTTPNGPVKTTYKKAT